MKNLLTILLISLLSPVLSIGQWNHVPNGSFEYLTTCPSASSNLTNCTPWFNYSGSPDVVNTCASGFMGVPTNNWGSQYAAHGNGYMGIITYNPSGHSREMAAVPITPLQPGRFYRVSMSVVLADKSKYGHNGMGALFFKDGPTYINIGNLPPNSPQIVYNTGPLTDTVNWVRLSDTFLADSAYDKVVVGSLIPNSSLTVTQIQTTASFNSYYYIDSLVVEPVDSLIYTINDTLQCPGNVIAIPFRIKNKKQSNNIFRLQLSDASGSFASPLNIGLLATDTSGTITGNIPANIPSGAGYKLRIVATNFPDTSYTTTISIKPIPANFNAVYNNPVCTGETINFTASSTSTGLTYAWTGPNSFNSTSATPFIGGSSPVHNGDYIVTATLNGCSLKDTVAVIVKPLPAKPVANNNAPVCAGQTLNLTASTSTNGVTWAWTGSGSYTSTSQNPNITNSNTAMSGDYIVTSELNGCNSKDTTTVLVKPTPAAVSTSSNTALCAGDTLKIFSTTSSPGVSYNWAGPGSFTSFAEDTIIANTTTAATGWYKMTVDLNGCLFKDSTYATVYPIPAAPVASHINPLCIGETLNLSTSNVTGATYSWTGANSFSSTQQNPTRSNMQFGDTGTYSVTVTVNGCTSPQGTTTVKINPTPFVVILANPADSICQGAPVLFTTYPNNHGGTPAYQWFVNGVASGTGVVFSTTALNHQDVIRCDMTENTKCSVPYTDPSNDIQMTVLPWLAPTVSISANPAHPLDAYEYVTFTATTTNAGNSPKFQWKRNGQNIVGATGSIWSANTLNDNDSIAVEITSNYKCPLPVTVASNWIKVKMTGVSDIHNDNRIVLYPNPNKGRFVIEASPRERR